MNQPGNSNTSMMGAAKRLFALMAEDKKNILLAFLGMIITSGVTIATPVIFGHVVDSAIRTSDYPRVLWYVGGLLIAFLLTFAINYGQMMLMGTVGQNVLYKLRNRVFLKLQELPIAFFHQSKAGDLISRINNDTDKLNQFFSETLMRFMGSIFIMIGAAIFIIVLQPKLALAALAPAVILLFFTQAVSGWVKRKNAESLQAVGALSGEVQESLDNFKVIVAFNRRDYFRARFTETNRINFKASLKAGAANNLFTPIYDLSSNVALLIVTAFGILLITQGQFTIGLLLSFLIYIERFYTPLRQIATFWSSLQVSLAGWDRVSAILNNPLTLETIAASTQAKEPSILAFKNVSFHYPDGKTVLKNITLELVPGKTYALVGPTGGGKTTTASLMARLYDPSEGTVLLNGQDMRSYTAEERTKRIGFILQEPFLFTGTLMDNLFHGNPAYTNASPEALHEAIEQAGLKNLLSRFPDGLETEVKSGSDTISLGQRQLIAFMRAVLRKPELLILDEATANIDTVTEQLLEETLSKLPKTTTTVIIAHRLNTIENADEIFFVNNGMVTAAGSFDHALELLMQGERKS